MTTSVKMVVVLTVISMLSGGILAVWDTHTKPLIEEQQLEALKSAVAEVLPPFDSYDEVKKGDMTFYVAHKKGEAAPVGIAFKTVGSGFQGKIAIMVGATPDFSSLTGVKILEETETPGLGTKIEEDPSNKTDPLWFRNQFKGLQTQPQIEYVKNQKPTKSNEIQAISGATITSRSVVAIMNGAIKHAREVAGDSFAGGNGPSKNSPSGNSHPENGHPESPANPVVSPAATH